MGAIKETPIPLAVRIELCRAGVQVIADRLGIRMLHIKGTTVDRSIRPKTRNGSDVDIIVDPAAVGILHEALLAHDWQVYSSFEDGSPFGHAQTYWNSDWGYIDLHRRFPGIGLADDSAFELLWDQHSTVVAAGREIAVPSVTAQAALYVLNAARGSTNDRAEAHRFHRALAVDERLRLDLLIDRLDAVVAAAVVSGELQRHRRRAEYLLWKTVSEGGTRTQEWWGRVRAARSWREALHIMMRAPRVNRSRLAHQLGHAPTRLDVFRAAMTRARVAVGELLPRRSRG
ncbi:nucleotidyltransferase family protein [Microbacterium sp.]|uniref:nucleotidyltransferase family protein n=1 Tax=Microbacterium sp. TaxID=51671 RepID=UPI0028123C42|nr:nucleotidyltransferase family protein [Microbacterium sp.]